MKIVIFLAGLLLLVGGALLSYQHNIGGASITYAAGILCFVFAFLGNFKKFKGLGIEAELLERKIQEADLKLEQLQKLLVPISELLFTMTARFGRWDSAFSRKESYRLKNQFEKELKDLGLSDVAISNSLREWHSINMGDLSRPIAQALMMALKQAQNGNGEIKLPAFHGAKNPYEEIVNFVNQSEVLDKSQKDTFLATHKEALEDLRFYSEHHGFRRLNHWLNEPGDDEL